MLAFVLLDSLGRIARKTLRFATIRHAKTAPFVLWKRANQSAIVFPIFTARNANISTTNVKSDHGRLNGKSFYCLCDIIKCFRLQMC